MKFNQKNVCQYLELLVNYQIMKFVIEFLLNFKWN